MHRITFFPLCKEGDCPPNAETFRIDLDNGRKVLGDYAQTFDHDNARYELRADLEKELRDDLAASGNRDYYDATMFTHLDDDHVCGAGDFFYFEAHPCRQGKTPGGKDRVKMSELWVPAAAICETGLEGDAEVIRGEARYRLKQKKGIRVFSAPGTLTEWCEKNGLDIDELRDLGLVIDAGKLVPGFTLANDGAEFFVHSPFASRTEDGQRIERNRDAIVMQVKFELDGGTTRFLITADVTYTELDEIVRMTRLRKNDDRLIWDIIDVAHHCSYTGIGPDKGKTKTAPSTGVKWLHEQGNPGGILVSSSCIIPLQDTVQPPHMQAAAYYEGVAQDIGSGEFVVTMEHPSKSKPEPLVIEITSGGAALKRAAIATVGGAAVASSAARVG